MTPFVWEGDDLILHLRVQPRASRNRVMGVVGERVKVALIAPPVEGAANEGLREFLAKEFRVAKGCVLLLRGESSREKSVRLIGVHEPTARDKLTDWGVIF